MNCKALRLVLRVPACSVALSLAFTLACNRKSTPDSRVGPRDAAQESPVGSGRSDDPGIDFQCVAESIRRASTPFHWSYKKTVTPLLSTEWEADITPNSIEGTFIDGSGTHAIHGVRSDKTGWDSAVMVLTGSLPASTFALVNNSSAIVQSGVEYVNGQNTIRYNIDTSQDAPPDAALIRNVLGRNGLIKGAAWVTQQGCPIKLILNIVQYPSDGRAQREYYEANLRPR